MIALLFVSIGHVLVPVTPNPVTEWVILYGLPSSVQTRSESNTSPGLGVSTQTGLDGGIGAQTTVTIGLRV